MIIVTGAAGFIGSAMLSYLIDMGHDRLVAVDDFGRMDKNSNLRTKKIDHLVHRDDALDWMEEHAEKIECVFHLGARTDTTEQDQSIFDNLNIEYSKAVWNWCTKHQVPLIYASSAATYGSGENGYKDDHGGIKDLSPLNPYGESKQVVDEWILEQDNAPPSWYGFKFFNVYGPNEYHKGRMASVVFHAFNQIQKTGKMKLFRSHKEGIEDGYQSRDFIYVKDVIEVLYWFYQHTPENAIYNLGTGTARPFIDLTRAVFNALNLEESIEFIDTPEDIRDTYQYFTEADMTKLKNTGCPVVFRPLESGVREYVKDYLVEGKYL